MSMVWIKYKSIIMSNSINIPVLVQEDKQLMITNVFFDPHNIICQKRFGFFGGYTPVIKVDDEKHTYKCEVIPVSVKDILELKK